MLGLKNGMITSEAKKVEGYNELADLMENLSHMIVNRRKIQENSEELAVAVQRLLDKTEAIAVENIKLKKRNKSLKTALLEKED